MIECAQELASRLGKRFETEERVAEVLLQRRGFVFVTDPMEAGQDAYDISLEALEEARAVLNYLYPGWV